MPINGVTPTVTITSITSITAQELAIRLLAAVSTNVVLLIAFPIESPSAASSMYDGYTETVTANVASGNFTRFLQSGGGVLQSASVTKAEFSAFSVKTTTRIQSPTSRPSISPKVDKNTSGVSYDIGLIVGLVFAGLALLAIILYLYFSRKTIPAGKEAKVVPGLENFLDLETVKAVDTTKKRPPTSQPKGFNTNNIHYDDTIEPITAIPEISNFESPSFFRRVAPILEEDEIRTDEVLDNMKYSTKIKTDSMLSEFNDKK